MSRQQRSSSHAGDVQNARGTMLLGLLAVVLGWLLLRPVRSGPQAAEWAGRSRRRLAASARRALAMKQARQRDNDRPHSVTPGEGMRPIPARGVAPSGALEHGGHRVGLERSHKVR